MCCLRYIPIEEIALFPKVTNLDLSRNEIIKFPQNFVQCLQDLTKLDLNSNFLRELPNNFGALSNLEYLNLNNNKLTDLPLSFSNLKNLTYLNLSDNPLRVDLSIEAGDEMAKQVQEDKKKSDKKSVWKEKQRTDSGESRGRQAKQHHLEQRKQKVPSPLQSDYLNGSMRWSWLGLINIFLFCSVLISASVCLILYTEGDLSQEGLKASWPRFINNFKLLQNKVAETVKYETIRSTSMTVWTYVAPFLLKIQETLIMALGALGNLISTSVQALEPLTGDLSPYYNEVVKTVSRVREFELTKFVAFICDGVRWFYSFIVAQFCVIKAEFWGNEAVVALWKDLNPVREFLWVNTATLRSFYWEFQYEVGRTWLPYGRKLAQDFYLYSRELLESLLVN
ncbi:Leucine-rich repeat-containing protein 59 [Armadillidium nasatum]|uniref:Leucine-rich repeat protein soc-2 homolog n=1 Tax=Armadillidium nasatum TaxID=96803 RepID=A0A5N5T393_9CRUS|nr:Leucine-rich repeat-containing protein 59 [Armadillidium nasatum]